MRVAALADELTGGRVVLTQEGGYHRVYSALSLHALVRDSALHPQRTDADLAAVRAALDRDLRHRR